MTITISISESEEDHEEDDHDYQKELGDDYSEGAMSHPTS
jgi:hypothetical protein